MAKNELTSLIINACSEQRTQPRSQLRRRRSYANRCRLPESRRRSPTVVRCTPPPTPPYLRQLRPRFSESDLGPPTPANSSPPPPSSGYSMENEHDSSSGESGKQSPNLVELLTKMSNRSKTAGSCNTEFEHFPTAIETFEARKTELKKSLVDAYLNFLNTASKEELSQSEGIGEKRATYILELREETPKPFKEIDDLKGLGLSSKQIQGMISKILADI